MSGRIKRKKEELRNHAEIMSIVAEAASKVSEEKSALIDSFCYKFEIGVLSNTLNQELTYREQADSLGLSMKELNIYKRIAKKFNNDINKFRLFIYENNLCSWSKLTSMVLPRKKSIKLSGRDIIAACISLNKVAQRIENKIADEHEVDTLITLSKRLARLIPLKKLVDKNFVKQQMCCGCGAEPVKGGHKLISVNFEPYILCPMCDKCIESSVAPEPERVAKIYYHYASGLEMLIDELKL